ncbi:hypothetical protein [Streptomyces griseomycini]|uniref:Uncharacterized protein n=1 Tax=Streptomyces griseomycini TaxID=66895 RepID=A0A7W7PWH1_9ACTN|nr:hypothetical protein [Streptomyces griseomycini]MBB4902555.1 hypothetical protein [Streptomyces griseomycini]GGR52365.1 hypothetical protein GCM10015536_67470 [Streptomyces griseomycini]
MADTESPRVLRLTFEFHVPVGLPTNIHGSRVTKAAEAFTSAVQALASQVFPWADRIEVRREWCYAWQDKSETVHLPATDKNTPK